MVNARQNTAPVAAKLIARFPFKMLTGGIVILKATVGDKPDSLNFVLDTGSGGISLDSLTVQYLGLPAVESDRTIRGIAGIRKVKFIYNFDLHLPGVNVEHLDFHINDYDILTSVYGLKIDGIIGYSFLSRYIIKLDYDTHIMEVWSPGTIRYPRGGYLLKPTIRNIPILDAAVKEKELTKGSFYFDTGAGLCLLMSERFMKDNKIFKADKKMTITQAEGLGGKKPMLITTVKQVRFGPYRFRKVPAHIFDDEFNITAYPQLGGLVGNDILRRFNLIINYQNNEIHMLPNTHYAEPFDYSYTGLGIYYINGEIIIEDVLESSPAEAAGLKPGDKILAVGTNFSNNIQEYKNLLQTAGARLKIIIVRDGEIMERMLRVRSIL